MLGSSWVKTAIESELDTAVGKIDLAVTIALTVIVALSNIRIEFSSGTFIFNWTGPTLGHIFLIGLILILSMITTGFYEPN